MFKGLLLINGEVPVSFVLIAEGLLLIYHFFLFSPCDFSQKTIFQLSCAQQQNQTVI